MPGTTTGTDGRIGTAAAGLAAFRRSRALDAGIVVAAALAAAVLLRTFVLATLHVPTPSMEPSLLSGDFILVSKLPFPPTEAGGVYAFHAPAVGGGAVSGEEVFVKRCVGVPGDTVLVSDGVVRVNGRRVRTGEAAGSEGTPTSLAGIRRTLVIPLPGERILLNDSTLVLWQSLVEREGHRVTRNPAGETLLDGAPARSYTVSQRNYFVAGDNSANSFDSRSWGLLPESAIIGRAILVYWSWDGDRSAARWGRVGMIVR